MELRCTLWRSQISPSATVNTGLASVSVKYSPIRNVVACQLVISMPSCCTKCCRLLCRLPSVSLSSTTERKESTKTSDGPCASTSATMRCSTRSRSPATRVVRQIDEADGVVDRLAVEEVELLLVAQHLQRRLAKHGEIERRALRRRQCEHHLVRQRGLAATGRPCDEVERELRQSTAKHFVQAGHAGGQAVDRHFVGHGDVSCAGGPLEEGAHTERSNRSVSEGPTKVASNS